MVERRQVRDENNCQGWLEIAKEATRKKLEVLANFQVFNAWNCMELHGIARALTLTQSCERSSGLLAEAEDDALLDRPRDWSIWNMESVNTQVKNGLDTNIRSRGVNVL